MQELMQLRNVKLEIQDQLIFENVNTNIQQGDVIGIIGKNGAGKTMLLQLLYGDFPPTKGHIKHLQENLAINMVEQETESYSFGEVSGAEETLLRKWNVPIRDFSDLSGGERLKARLARGLANDADILLMDEPTNHLDEQSSDFLLHQINRHKGTVILVSHDRYFLDNAATVIWSLEDQKLISHRGTYTDYMQFREKERERQQHEYDKQQKMKAEVEGQISQLSSWSTSAHKQSTKQEFAKEYYRVKAKRMDVQVKSKRKRLQKELEKINVDAPKPEYQVNFSLASNQRVGKRFLEVKNLGKSFAGETLFAGVNFTIQHGEKLAVTGPNGSGKTTFLNMVLGKETMTTGDIWVSPSANIGYLTQEVFDLPLDQTPEQLFDRTSFQEQGHVRTVMKHLGFLASQWTEPIRNMSMGERVKCKLMKYILEERDVLILDEPTNHLDLPSREQLEETLAQYNGTLLVVSHDRYFLERTTDMKLVFTNQTIRKQFAEGEVSERDDKEDRRLRLETERQEVLGKLSLLTPGHEEYEALDVRFTELTRMIRELE